MEDSGRALSSETIHKIEWLLALAAYRARKNKAPHVLKHWVDRPIQSFGKRDVADVIGGLKRRGKIETAHRLLHALARVFKYAVGTNRIPRNPALEFSDSGDPRDKLPPAREQNYPALTDPREVGGLLRAIDSYNGQPTTQAAFKLAPYLFSRPKELRKARWSEFDLDGGTPAWRVPAPGMKMRVAHIVPLPKQAVKILNDLHTLTGPEGYVFPQVKDPSRPMSENTLTAALRRMGYTGEQMTWHGFRTTASALLRVRQDWKWRAVSKPRTDVASDSLPPDASYRPLPTVPLDVVRRNDEAAKAAVMRRAGVSADVWSRQQDRCVALISRWANCRVAAGITD